MMIDVVVSSVFSAFVVVDVISSHASSVMIHVTLYSMYCDNFVK
jgi:hypothetical protein